MEQEIFYIISHLEQDAPKSVIIKGKQGYPTTQEINDYFWANFLGVDEWWV